MPRLGSDLKKFIMDALLIRKYKNLFYSDEEEGIFSLRCPRKDSSEYCLENIKIFMDWDSKKNHKFDYTHSRQRLESALKRSIYFKSMSSKKDVYFFKFNNEQEIASKKEEQRRRNRKNSGDKYTSDGESLPSSPESFYSLSPVDINFPVSSPSAGLTSDAEAGVSGSPEAASSNDRQDILAKVTEDMDPVYDAVSLNPSFTPDSLDCMEKFWSTYLNDSATDTVPFDTELPDFLRSAMDCEPIDSETSDCQNLRDVAVESQQAPEVFRSLETSVAVQEKPNLDLEAIKVVLQLIPNITGLQLPEGSTDVSYLVNNCYLVTLRKPSVS